MSRSSTIVALLLLLSVGALSGSPLRAAEEAVKIKDSRLHSINYGADSLQHWVDKAQQGDTSRAAALLRDLEKLSTRFNRIPNSNTEEYKFVATRLQALRSAIAAKSGDAGKDTTDSAPQTTSTQSEPVKPHAGLRNIETLLAALEKDVVRYGDHHKQRSRLRNDVATLQTRLGRIAEKDHPDFSTIQSRLNEVKKALQPSGGPLNMTAPQVAAYVEQIRVRYSEQIRLPEARDIMANRELTAADVDGIVAKLKGFGENADQDLPKLRRVVEATGQGEYWLRWLDKQAIEQLTRNMESIKAVIDQRVNSELRTARQRSELDPQKNRYAFTNEAMLKQHTADYERTLRTLQQAARLEKLLGLPATWSPRIKDLRQYMETWREKAGTAIIVRELPADVGNEELHAIARKVLGQKKYGVGNIVRIIVNSQPVPRDRTEHKVFNGKIETIVREWKQFQVTTVEADEGKLFVYVNDLAKFSRAPAPTPIDRWILTKRFKRGEISKEDFASH